MQDSTLFDRIRALVSAHAGAPMATLGPASTPQNTEGWDSVANLSLMEAIEEEFELTLSTRDAMSLKSLGDIAAFVERARKP
jgi:acyl carrier protein